MEKYKPKQPFDELTLKMFYARHPRANDTIHLPSIHLPKIKKEFLPTAVVKINYTSSERLAQILKYNDRAEAKSNMDVSFFSETRDSFSKSEVKEINEEKHLFRFMLSPGVSNIDMHSYVRNVMRSLSKEMGTTLDYVAINHYNTANQHSHVLIRGISKEGSVVKFPKEFFAEKTFLKIANEVREQMTSFLVFQETAQENEYVRSRDKLDLDEDIIHHKDNLNDLSMRHKKRLVVLHNRGIIKKENRKFIVPENFLEKLSVRDIKEKRNEKSKSL